MAEKDKSLKSTLEKKNRTAKQLADAYNTMSGTLRPDNRTLVLNDLFSELLIKVMQKRVAYGITVSSVVPHKNSGNSAVTDTASLKETVPGTKVTSIRINLRGSYENYEGLTGYLKSLRELPISVVYLKVQERNFELGLRIYGN